MKMARATQEDLDAALIVNGILSDVLEDEQMPRNADGEFEDDGVAWFDEDDFQHLRLFYDRLKAAYRKRGGAMNRVVWGMSVLCDPQNRVIHPESDHLMLHPSLRYVEDPAAESVDVVAEQQAAEGGKEGL